MRSNYLYIFLFVLLVGTFSSCDSDKNDGIDFLIHKGTKSEAFAGDWYVRMQNKATMDYTSGYGEIRTFNTAENEKNLFWINDDSLFGYQIKCQGDDDLSFASIDDKSIKYGNDGHITLGQIFIGQGLSKTGNVTDSIYLEAVFVSKPGITFIISGHKNTRRVEDDYK